MLGMHERQPPVQTEPIGAIQRMVLGRVARVVPGQTSQGRVDYAGGEGGGLSRVVL